MTFDEALKLPNRTRVQLLDGKVWRLAIWHKGAQRIGVEVPGEDALRTMELRTLEPARLRLEPDGSCRELPVPRQ